MSSDQRVTEAFSQLDNALEILVEEGEEPENLIAHVKDTIQGAKEEYTPGPKKP